MSTFTIRTARESDAAKLLSTFKQILKDSQWVLSEPDEIRLVVQDERRFIRKYLKSKNSLLAVAVAGNEIIGVLNVDGGLRRRSKHVASIGISISKKWRNMGVGTAMMKYLFNWAKKARIRKVKLCVIVNNRPAIHLYRKLGFVTEGISRREIKIGRRYYNTIEMAKFL